MDIIFITGFIVAVILLILTIEFSRRDKLNRREFFIWLALSTGLAFFSLLPSFLKWVTSLFGIGFAGTFVSVVGIFVLLILNIYTFSEINENSRKIKKLAQEIALLKAEERGKQQS